MNAPEEFLFPPYKDEFKQEIVGVIKAKTNDFSKPMFPKELWDVAIAYSLAMSVKFYDLFEDSGCTAFSGMYKKQYGWTLPSLSNGLDTGYSQDEFIQLQFRHIIEETCSACRDLFIEFKDVDAQICSDSARTFLEDIDVARKIATEFFIDDVPIVSDIRFTTQSERDFYAKEMQVHIENAFYAHRNDLNHVRQEAILFGCKKCLHNYDRLFPSMREKGEDSQFKEIQDSIIGDCCEAAMVLLQSFRDEDALKCKNAIENLLTDKENASRITSEYFERGISFLNPDFSCFPCKDECWEGMKPTMLKVQKITQMYLGTPQLHEIVVSYVCERMLDLYDKICVSCIELTPSIKTQIQDKSDHLVSEAGSAVMDRFSYFGEDSILYCKKQVDTMLSNKDKARALLRRFKSQLG